MSEKNILSRIQHKHDIEANWIKAVNFIPKKAELIVYDPDENFDYSRAKIGDGIKNVNDLPFMIDKTEVALKTDILPSDWNQNDPEAADYVKNRPFYTGDPVETTLISEQTVAFEDSGAGFGTAISSVNVDLVEGNTYIVIFDGETYECTCQLYGGMAPIIGSPKVFGGEDTGEPFMYASVNDMYVWYAYDTETEHTLSLSGIERLVVQIPEKYLPESATMQSNWNENDENSVAFIKNRPCYMNQFPIFNGLSDERHILVGTNTFDIGYNCNFSMKHLYYVNGNFWFSGIDTDTGYASITIDGIYNCTGYERATYIDIKSQEQEIGGTGWRVSVRELYSKDSVYYPGSVVVNVYPEGPHTDECRVALKVTDLNIIELMQIDDMLVPATIARIEDIPEIPIQSVNGMTGDVVIDIPEVLGEDGKLLNDVLPDGYPYKTKETTELITWDGNTDGLVTVNLSGITLCKISDNTLTKDELNGAIMRLSNGTDSIEMETVTMSAGGIVGLADSNSNKYGAYIVYSDNYDLYGTVFPEAGIYWFNMASDGYYLTALSKVDTTINTISKDFLPTDFIVDIVPNESGDSYTANKTYDEIYKEVVSGRRVTARFYSSKDTFIGNAIEIPLVEMPGGNDNFPAVFYGVCENGRKEDVVKIVINDSDSIRVTFDSLPTISTATVGQTIVVKNVDESGRPKEWKAVDMPEQMQPDWAQTDETASDFIKNKPIEMTDDDALNLLLELSVVEPVTNENSAVFTDENGAIFVL